MRVIPSTSVQAGLAAIGRFVATNSPDENAEAMREALAAAATGEVTVASRDAELDGIEIRKGAYLGFVEGAAVVSNADLDAVASEVVERSCSPTTRSSLRSSRARTLPSSMGSSSASSASTRTSIVDVHDGGQPHYPLLVVAE